jgi:hypothetical protein
MPLSPPLKYLLFVVRFSFHPSARVLSALLLLLFPLLPESPRYLIAKGQTDAAEKVRMAGGICLYVIQDDWGEYI